MAGLGEKRCSSFHLDIKVSGRGGGLKSFLKEERHLFWEEALGPKGAPYVENDGGIIVLSRKQAVGDRTGGLKLLGAHLNIGLSVFEAVVCIVLVWSQMKQSFGEISADSID